MNADKELTASGMACVTLTRNIKLAISSMKGSEVLKVFSDDPASVWACSADSGDRLIDLGLIVHHKSQNELFQ